jgi:GTPase SAR1 family protein
MTFRQMPDPAVAPSPDEVTEVCESIAAAVATYSDPRTKDQAAAAIRDEVDRITAGAAEVVVVGEKKAGKSSLINALVEWPELLPVDVDVATNVHITVHYADQPEALAYLEGAADPVIISLEEIAAFAALDPQTGQSVRDDVRYVTVGVPSPLLRSGLTLIDTPGVDGLLAGHAYITRAMLRQSDALIFVTSASGELTKSALSFLAEATTRIASVFFVLAQVDLHADWQRVLERNRKLVAEHASGYASAPWFPVSSRAESEAIAASKRGDEELARSRRELSGCDPLRSPLVSQIAEHSQDLRMRNALHLARPEADALVDNWQLRIRMLSLDPGLASDLADRQRRLKQLENTDAQWRTELARGMQEFDRELRDCLRRSADDIQAMAETKIALSAKAKELNQIPEDMEEAITGVYLDLNLTATEALSQVISSVQDKIGEVDLQASASLAMPSRMGQPSAFVRSAHDAKGFIATVERAAPALGLGMLVGSVLAVVSSGILLPVIGGVGAMALLSERRKNREALVRGRADANRYMNRVLRQLRGEFPAQISATTKDVGNRLRDEISAHLDQQRRDLEGEIAAQQSFLQAATGQLDRDRTQAQQELDSFSRLRDSAVGLETRLDPSSKNS